MRTIAIFNLKGGVGKTLTTATMAYCLAQDHEKTVLLVDADCQGNLSQYMGVPAEAGSTTLDLMRYGAGYYPDFVTPANPRLGIDIIPADMSLAEADMAAIKDGRCNLQAINDLRTCLEEDAAYDFMLIDCPPAFSAASSAALVAADEVIIPVRLDAFSTAGMAELSRQVDNMRKFNPRLRVAGILATQYQKTPEEREAHRYLDIHSDLPVFRTMIRMSPKVAGSTYAQKSLLEHSPYCGASKDYRSWVQEYLEGGEQDAV